jgi:hypothetical protein
MPRSQFFARSLNDVGLAAWFGGSLMGAVGLNESASRQASNNQAAAVASTGWARWTPLNLGAIASHLAGATMLLVGNRERVVAQRGVATASTVKAGLTLAALGATGYARLLGKRVEANQNEPAEGGVAPTPATSPDVAGPQRQLAVLQWVIPVLTGGMIIFDAVLGEQERPAQVAAGTFVGRVFNR